MPSYAEVNSGLLVCPFPSTLITLNCARSRDMLLPKYIEYSTKYLY